MLGTILVVDDNDADLVYTKIILEELGVAKNVRTVDRASEALALLRESTEHVDLILLDINMPGMNGFEFLDAHCPAGSATASSRVVVMLSSSLLSDDRDRSFEYPCVKSYISKPIDAAQVNAMLQDVERS